MPSRMKLGAPMLVAALVSLVGCSATSREDANALRRDFVTAEACHWPNGSTLSSVVKISTDSGSNASGVVVAENRVLTVAHAVDDAAPVAVRFGQTASRAKLLGLDRFHDLALLSVDTGSALPVPVGFAELEYADEVWAVGYPFAADQQVTHGAFQQRLDHTIYSSAPVDSGVSGGGLLQCRKGVFELAGVVRGFGAYRRDGELVNSHTLSTAVSADQIRSFINSIEPG